jgi:hypothetical protein
MSKWWVLMRGFENDLLCMVRFPCFGSRDGKFIDYDVCVVAVKASFPAKFMGSFTYQTPKFYICLTPNGLYPLFNLFIGRQALMDANNPWMESILRMCLGRAYHGVFHRILLRILSNVMLGPVLPTSNYE